MVLGIYLALGLFVLLVGSVFALTIRIDRMIDHLNRRIDTIRQLRH